MFDLQYFMIYIIHVFFLIPSFCIHELKKKGIDMDHGSLISKLNIIILKDYMESYIL